MAKVKQKQKSRQKPKAKSQQKVNPFERKKMINNLFKKENKRTKIDRAENEEKVNTKKKHQKFKRNKSDGNFSRDRIAELDKKFDKIRKSLKV